MMALAWKNSAITLVVLANLPINMAIMAIMAIEICSEFSQLDAWWIFPYSFLMFVVKVYQRVYVEKWRNDMEMI